MSEVGPIEIQATERRAQSRRGAVVLTFDSVNTAFLGPYGNTWLATPGWNQLAASSLLMEQCLTPNTQAGEAFQNLWGGTNGHTTLAEQLCEHSVTSRLISDDEKVLQIARETGFSSVETMAVPSATQAVDDLEQTTLFQQIDTALHRISSADHSATVNWIHLQGMMGPWDAPTGMRDTLFDEEIGDPPTWILPSPITNQDPLDSDDLLRWQVSYGAQIQVIDFCLQATQNWLEAIPSSIRPLLIVSAPRGCNLGAHGSCLDDATLWTDTAQVPLFVVDGEHTRSLRSQGLASWLDIGPTLIDYVTEPPYADSRSLLHRIKQPGMTCRDRCLLRSQHEVGIRTEDWFLKLRKSSEPNLFVKPDDRNDINEISQRLGSITEQLRLALTELRDSKTESASTGIPGRLKD